MAASTEKSSFAETDIKQEIIQLEDTVESFTIEGRQEFLIKDDPGEVEMKNVITQDNVDLGETVVGEPNRAVHDEATLPDIKQELLDLEETVEDLSKWKKEELHIKDDTDEKETKYVNTQDYLDIGETMVGEPNGAVPDVSTSSDITQEMMKLKASSIMKKEELCTIAEVDRMELKYVNTQDYLDISETVVGEPNGTASNVATSSDITQEMMKLKASSIMKKEELCTIAEVDRMELKYVNTQDYLDISETVVGEPNGAASNVATSSGDQQQIFKTTNLKKDVNGKFQCKLCDYWCNQRGNFKRHMGTLNLNKHMRTHSGEKPFQCEICDYRCNRGGNLKRHMRTHSGEKPFQCEMCDYRCNQGGSLKTHMRTHSGEKLFQCKMCDYRCYHGGSLKTHMRTHSDEKPFQCEICDYRCNQRGSLKKHMRTHSGEKPFQCEICYYRCNQEGSLKKHMRTHLGEKPFQCEICDYRCNQGGSLKTHMRTHSGEKPFQCEICDYRCNRGGNLKKHMRTHSAEKPFQCEICDYRCNQGGSLKTHMRTHSGEKPFQCEICDYRCNQGGSLKTHMRTHSGEKPFQCEICDYRCNQGGSLKIHMRTHSGEKPFQCEMCDYRCNHGKSLKTHMRTHSDEKPFQCEMCDYRCNHGENLKRHMRTHDVISKYFFKSGRRNS